MRRGKSKGVRVQGRKRGKGEQGARKQKRGEGKGEWERVEE